MPDFCQCGRCRIHRTGRGQITKHLIKDLGLPKGTTIGGMIRNGEGILVTGDTQIRPGDHVVVFCLSMMIKKIEKFFN